MTKAPAVRKTESKAGGTPRPAAKPKAGGGRSRPVVDVAAREAIRKIAAFLVAMRPVPSRAEDELRAVEAELENL